MKFRLTIIFFFLLSGSIRAGGPMSPILAICEVKTVDTTIQGIIYMYKGGTGCLCPNGFYISWNIDSSVSTGDFYYFTLNFRKYERFQNKYGVDSLQFLYTKNLIKESSKNPNFDTICCYLDTKIYFINFLINSMFHITHNRTVTGDHGKIIIPSERLDDKFYSVSDTFSIFTDLQVDSKMHFTIPAPMSEIKIPVDRIKSINIIKTPNDFWLNKINKCRPEWNFSTKWFHQIVSSKKSIKKFLKDFKEYIECNINYS